MANDGTVIGAVTFGAGQYGNGASNFATTRRIEFAASPLNLSAAADWSIRVQLKTSYSGGTEVAVDGGGSSNAIWLGVQTGGKVNLTFNGTAHNTNTVISDGLWHEVEFCYRASDTTLYGFVDGVLVYGPTVVTHATPTGVGNIGTYTPGGFSWSGEIDDLGTFDAVMHTATYTPAGSAISTSATSLVSLYNLNADGTDSKASVTVVSATPAVGEYGPSSVALSWAVATGGTGPYNYQLQRSASGAGTWANRGSDTTARSYTDTGLSASTAYDWRVIATDANSVQGTSSTRTKTTLATGIKYNRLDLTVSGQAALVLVPNANAALPYASSAVALVQYFHSRGSTETQPLDATSASVVAALMDAGYILCCSAAHANNWGMQSAIDDCLALDTAVALLYSVSDRLLLSTSMGGIVGLLCLAAGSIPSMKAWAGVYPCCSLADLYLNGTFAADIDTDYAIDGSHSYATQTAGHDPYLIAASSFRLPMRFYASSADATVSKANNSTAMAAHCTAAPERTVVDCTGDHGDASHWQPTDVAAFFVRARASRGSSRGLRAGCGMALSL